MPLGKHAPGLIQVRATYIQRHSPASMVFYQVVGGTPTIGDCQRAADAVSTWDADGAGPGLAYRLFRSSTSRLLEVEARSLDPMSTRTYMLQRDDSATIGAEVVSDPLTMDVAPLAYWICLPGQIATHGRTYLHGLCHNVLQEDAPDLLNDSAVPALHACLEGLITLLAVNLDAIMVIVTTRHHGVELSPSIVSQIGTASLGRGQVGTQRRRVKRMVQGWMDF